MVNTAPAQFLPKERDMAEYYRARSWPFCDGNICHGERECGYGPRGCDGVWELYQQALAGAFQEANPQLDLSRFSDVHIGSKTAKYDVDGVTVLIHQPYSHVQVDEASYASSGLGVKSGGTGRSWYFPARSQLLVVAPPHVLDTIRLDYPLPDPSLRPVRCVRWHRG